MNRFYTLIFLFLSSLVQAKISDISLNAEQYTLLLQFRASNNDTGKLNIDSFKKFYKDNKLIKNIDTTDIIAIAKLLYQNNSLTYLNDKHHLICKKLSEDIINSEFYKRCLLIAKEQNIETGNLFAQNLITYLHNEIFNFYHDNNVLSFLDKPDYLEVLKPVALIDLLEKQKGDNFIDELTFIIRNSKYNLYK